MKRPWKHERGLGDWFPGSRNWGEGFPAIPLMSMLIVGLLVSSASSAIRQEQLPPLPEDPTPLVELITVHERELLASAASDPKRQVEILLDLSSAHLDASHSAIE